MGILNKIRKIKDDKEGSVKDETAVKAKKVTKNNTKTTTKVIKDDTRDAYKILVKPLVSEKSSLGSEQNKYSFVVYDNANKPEVSKAVFAVYGVKPTDVNIMNVRGKKVRSGKTSGKRKDWKKAIVTLPKGKTIQLYEGI